MEVCLTFKRMFLFFFIVFFVTSCSLFNAVFLSGKDTDGPEVQILYPENHFVIETNVLPVSMRMEGSATDESAIRSIQVSVNGGGFAKAEGQSHWSYLLIMNQFGDYQIDVFGVDEYDNIGFTQTFWITLRSNQQ